MTKESLKKEILLALSKDTLSAFSLLQKIKGKNQNLSLTVKSIGSTCGELVREGQLIKEKLIINHDHGFYTFTPVWIEKTVELIRKNISLEIPSVESTTLEILEEENILSGRTRITGSKVTVVIYISRNLLSKKNIVYAIKAVLIHEYCHLVDLENPDRIMKEYFPKEFKVWDLTQKAKGLECSHEEKFIKDKEV